MQGFSLTGHLLPFCVCDPQRINNTCSFFKRARPLPPLPLWMLFFLPGNLSSLPSLLCACTCRSVLSISQHWPQTPHAHCFDALCDLTASNATHTPTEEHRVGSLSASPPGPRVSQRPRTPSCISCDRQSLPHSTQGRRGMNGWRTDRRTPLHVTVNWAESRKSHFVFISHCQATVIRGGW